MANGRTERGTERMQKERVMYNVSTPTEYERNGKKEVFWTNVGKGFEGDKGITIRLNVLPISGTLFLSNNDRDNEQ